MAKKIMFSEKYGLTTAVLEGNKTQTRRLVKEGTPLGNFEETLKSSRYDIGDIVAIAQSYKSIGYDIAALGDHAGWNNKLYVCADFMPHRIKITDIRIERLKEISDEDCLTEGISLIEPKYYKEGVTFYGFSDNNVNVLFNTPQEAFSALIDRVCGKGTWDSNPWVFAFDFELVK